MDKSWRVILAFIGIFVAGTVTGGLITLRVVQTVKGGPRGERWFRSPPPGQAQPASSNNPAPPQIGLQLFRRITDQLDLTPEQKEKIRPIEVRTSEDLRRLRRDVQHNTELLIEKSQDEIAAILTPEQRAKFEELVARGRERVKKFMQEQDLNGRLRREQNQNRQREALPSKDK